MKKKRGKNRLKSPKKSVVKKIRTLKKRVKKMQTMRYRLQELLFSLVGLLRRIAMAQPSDQKNIPQHVADRKKRVEINKALSTELNEALDTIAAQEEYIKMLENYIEQDHEDHQSTYGEEMRLLEEQLTASKKLRELVKQKPRKFKS